MIKIRYCSKCVYPNNAVNLEMNESNICSACGVGTYFDQNENEFWAQREKKFEKRVREEEAKIIAMPTKAEEAAAVARGEADPMLGNEKSEHSSHN